MDIKTIFGIAIKLIGVYFLFGTTPDVILQSTVVLTQDLPDYMVDYSGQSRVAAVVGLVFWIFMPLILIFMTDKIVGALDLLKGFGESSSLTLNDNAIMKAGLIFIGGFCIIDHLPTLSTLAIMFIKQIASGRPTPTDDIIGRGSTTFGVIKESIGLILGIGILTNYDRLARALMPRPDNESL